MLIKVIDAVMGTGKSTWAIQQLKATGQRTIVVLPYRAEIKRYADALLEDTPELNVTALYDDIEGQNKQERFEDALQDAHVIITTHTLLKDFLKLHLFQLIEEGHWHLLMDEAIATFEPIKSLSKTMLDGWLVNGIVEIRQLNERLRKIEPVSGVTEMYTRADNFMTTPVEKYLLKGLMVNDMLAVKDQSAKGFFTFSLSESRLKSFKSMTVLTYMFLGSDLDYWCRMKGIGVAHLELTRDAEDLFHLASHSGQYSGAMFKSFIEILDVKSSFGNERGQLSATSSRALKKKSKRNITMINEVQKDLKRHFRNRKKNQVIEPEDFMYASLSDIRGIWSGKDLPTKFIGESTWVPYNKRGVNGYAHKHNLAFLYNVFQHLAVKQTVNSVISEDSCYSEDTLALSTLLQWIWRSAIRKGEKVRVYIPSKRMRDLLINWLGWS
ncbi:hypothetical protein SAMN02746065_10489 [Desulfocicer vacuolatum DSM 3385]|uniref:Type III restriction enzyme, res subunit n=1 Tax=Desulfocicer vacuolatum DSM 3385 TaxID=1121400 RepID=A0A1W2A4Q8_9BACT|nr:DEAD/DEAH box helicase family protein [Desulfocicer vacuolatum]SMC55401.1 hypothetical protein SAMN02746065_10489 [Desulfocicer vacuolatum DSM 3385]